MLVHIIHVQDISPGPVVWSRSVGTDFLMNPNKSLNLSIPLMHNVVHVIFRSNRAPGPKKGPAVA